MIDDLLLASGWTQRGGGWRAPDDFRGALALHMGAGTVSRGLAIGAQAQSDEAVCSGAIAVTEAEGEYIYAAEPKPSLTGE